MSRQLPIKVINPANTKLIIVGVGGTGGYLLQQVARLLFALKEQGNRIPSVLLIDGDDVEKKNLLRQYFLPQDVGKKKTAVLADRYARAYGLNIMAYPEYITWDTDFKEIGIEEDSIVIGCVDNGSTRKILHEKLSGFNHVVYIDSGNGSVTLPDDQEHIDRYQLAKIKDSGWSGQVVVGVRAHGQFALPFVGEEMPDMIEEDRLPTEVSCGEVVVSEPQHLLTNLMAATSILIYLHTLLVDGTILHHRTFFDARRGYVTCHAAIDSMLEVSI